MRWRWVVILDLSRRIDFIIEEFPCNSILQQQLGLGDRVILDPFKSIGDLKWDQDEFVDGIRSMARHHLEIGTFCATDDREIETRLSKLVRLMDRFIIIKLVGQSKSELFPEIPPDIFEAYYLAAKKGCENEINQLLRELGRFADNHIREVLAVAKLVM